MDLAYIQNENMKELANRGMQEDLIACTQAVLTVKRESGFMYIGKNWESEVLDEAYPFAYGMGRAKKQGRYVFFNKQGAKSREFAYAEDFQDSIALVQPKKNGKYYFMNKRGDLSQPYDMIYSCKCGNYRVAKENAFTFVDTEGNECEDRFVQASNYHYGFARVQKEGDLKIYYRDMLGRISEDRTLSGEEFFKFASGEIQLEEIDKSFFENEDFARGVVGIIKNRAISLRQEALTKELRQKIGKQCYNALKYVLVCSQSLGFSEIIFE